MTDFDYPRLHTLLADNRTVWEATHERVAEAISTNSMKALEG